ncbi:3'-5' exonuclease, partial [Georgenia sp. 10Sc9-8]|nr:3'-5' exonuclease [Georgenia halotolerans]
GAFLAWLDAAEAHERGLDAVEPEADPGAVQVLTVHAAKGLEWDVVAVPGLVESQFPSYDGTPAPDGSVNAAGWLTSLRELPYPLRGDAESLPRLDLSSCVTHADVRDACVQLRADGGTHRVAEERRLAYVAMTRARHTLLLSGSWFRGGKTPLPPSRFLREPWAAGQVQDAGEDAWAPEPEDGAANPALTEVVEAVWPDDPLGPRRGRLERAALAVHEAIRAEQDGRPVLPPVHQVGDPVARRWLRDAELLLAERAERAHHEQEVDLGGHVSASGVVNLLADPRGFARDRRRPVPTEPTVVSRRGTRFHEWVEHFYGAASLLDVEELPGGLTPGELTDLPDAELRRLQETFAASPWATRTPVAVEVDLETPVAGTHVRCRIDAVFDDEHGVEVVDWKTGRPPATAEEVGEREMQLALYRLAWSRTSGTPLAQIGAAFYYVGHDRTVRAGALSEDEIVERITQALAAGA